MKMGEKWTEWGIKAMKYFRKGSIFRSCGQKFAVTRDVRRVCLEHRLPYLSTWCKYELNIFAGETSVSRMLVIRDDTASEHTFRVLLKNSARASRPLAKLNGTMAKKFFNKARGTHHFNRADSAERKDREVRCNVCTRGHVPMQICTFQP